MSFLFPEVTAVTHVNMTAATKTIQDFIQDLIAFDRHETKRAIERSIRSKERLDRLIVEERLVSREHMSQRLREFTPKWGDTLPDLDSEEIIATWRRKRGI